MIAVGMAALGFLTGILITLSSTPLAAAALPLLFSFAGAAAGFFVGKVDLTTDKNQEKVRLIGICLASMCGACLVAIPFGVMLKHSYRDWAAERSRVDVSKHENTSRAIVIRAKLTALGASNPEIQTVLGNIAKVDEGSIDAALKLLAAKELRPVEVPAVAHEPGATIFDSKRFGG